MVGPSLKSLGLSVLLINILQVNYTDENDNFYTLPDSLNSSYGASVWNVTGLTPGTIYTFSSWGFKNQNSGDSCTASGKTGKYL